MKKKIKEQKLNRREYFEAGFWYGILEGRVYEKEDMKGNIKLIPELTEWVLRQLKYYWNMTKNKTSL